MVLTAGETGSLEWAVAERPHPAEQESGDAFVVLERPEGPLVAVIDGLGHGPEAARAAETAVAALRSRQDQPVDKLVSHCSDAMRSTRGAVMALAAFDDALATITWIGVGNISALLAEPQASAGMALREVVQRGGVVGGSLPALHPVTLPVAPGTILVVATDGLHPGFRDDISPYGSPEVLAAQLLRLHASETDDALVLVCRFRSATP